MEIDCQINLLTCDIDQFYIIKVVNLHGSKNGVNLGEIYNLCHIIDLSIEGIIINSKIKLLRSLKVFSNTVSTRDGTNNMIIGNLEAFDALCSMNINFTYGYFPQQMSLKHINNVIYRKSHTFSGYYIARYGI